MEVQLSYQKGMWLFLLDQIGLPPGHRTDCDFSGKFALLREESFVMKRKQCREEQITFALRQVDSGTPVEEVIRRLGGGPRFGA